MNNELSAQLSAYNQLWKEWDDVYHGYAASLGLSDTAFWIMYLLRSSERRYTQRQLCDEWFYSPQTVNSALRKLCEQGLVKLTPTAGNKKSKELCLTYEGLSFARDKIDPLIDAERSSFALLSEQERVLLLSILHKNMDFLKTAVENISRKEN